MRGVMCGVLDSQAMPRLLLDLLGGFQARLEPGSNVTLPARKTTALLAYLAMPAGQAHPREKLAALLWSDADASRARSAVRQVLFNLRRTLAAADALRIQGETVALDPAAVHVDVSAFECAVADGSPEALERGLALYRGDLLAGLTLQEPPFEEWLLIQRERLRELAQEALARLLTHQRGTGDLEGAVKTALRLLALDPIQETVHRTLMRLYAEGGRRGAALRQYQLCVTALQRELGIGPEAETKELYQHVLRLRPVPVPRAFDAPAPGNVESAPRPPVGDWPLVGRAAEMARLRGALDAAAGRRGMLVAIFGEAGLGKTRLVAELESEGIARGARILAGRAYEAAQILSYGPWVDALRAAGVVEDEELLSSLDPLRRSELSRVLPGVSTSPPAPGPAEPVHAFEAIAGIIEGIGRRQLLLIVLEDLQWGDEMSIRFLGFLGRRIRASPVLGVITVRDEDLPAAPFLLRTIEDLERAGHLDVIRLAPLPRAETTELARAVAPRALADRPGFEDRVWRISEGNPFIVVEAVRGGPEGPLPETVSSVPSARVRQLIGRRLDRLGAPARDLVAAAAVAGGEPDFDFLRMAAGLNEVDAAEGLEELVRLRIVHRVVEGFGFTHDRIREVVYDGLLAPRKMLLHRRAGELLEATPRADRPAHLETVGVHYRLGEVWDKAADYLEQAGRAAAEKSAHGSAATAYQQALVAVGHLGESASQRVRACDLHFARAYSLGWSGATQDALDGHARSVALAEALGDDSRLQRALTGMCSALASAGRHVEALDTAERALARAIAARDSGGQFWLNINLARICYALGDYRRAITHGRQGQDCLAREPSIAGAVTRDLPPPVAYRSWLVLNLAMVGEFAAGMAVGDELTALVASMDWPRARLSAASNIGSLLLAKGEVGAAIRLLDPALGLCREAGLWAFLPRIASVLGTALAVSGRPADGLPVLQEAVTQSRAARYMYDYPGLLCDLGTTHLLAGHVDEARRLAAEALALSRSQAARGSEAAALRLTGQVAMQASASDDATALASLQDALALAETLGARPAAAHCHAILGTLHRRSGRLDQASAEVAIATREFRVMQMLPVPDRGSPGP
jgi:DNA-binding SARP family transcriptional activator